MYVKKWLVLGLWLGVTLQVPALASEGLACEIASPERNQRNSQKMEWCQRFWQEDSVIGYGGSRLPILVQDTFVVADSIAEFQGGMSGLMRFIHKHIRYPNRCIELEIEGRVLVDFVVEQDGSVSGVHVLKKNTSCPEMDAEAMRIITLTSLKWKPAIMDGEPVRSRYRLPVDYRLM
jgi:TonB family protein